MPDDPRPDDPRPDDEPAAADDIDRVFLVAAGAPVDPHPDDPVDHEEHHGPDLDDHDGEHHEPFPPGVVHSVYPDAGASVARPFDDPDAAWGRPQLPPAAGRNFERRPARHGPVPDAHGYYPDEYYVPTDWTHLVLRITVGLVLVMGLAIAGTSFWDRYGPSADDDIETVAPTPTVRPLVPVYQCAGDPEPVAQMAPPAPILIGGRTADNRWLAFRNPTAPPTQLWVLATDVPTVDPTAVGIVSCADAPDEFPTPIGNDGPRGGGADTGAVDGTATAGDTGAG